MTPSARYNLDGDIIFSVAKDQQICAWFAHNGERLGTYHGHVGAIWTVDVDPTSTMIASGSADNTIRLWEIKTGKCLKTWEFPTAVKRVEFNEDGSQLLGVTEKRMGYLSNIIVLDINPDPTAEQSDERALTIVCHESKATVAGWSYLSKWIISGHEDGSVSQYDAKARLPLLGVSTCGISLTWPRREIKSTTTRSTNSTRPSPIFSGLPTGRTSSLPPRTRLPSSSLPRN